MKRLPLILAAMLVCTACTAKIKQYKVEVVKEYDHDPKAYTQGLFFRNGELFESTGQFGQSSLRKVDLSSGKVLRKLNFDKKYFGEGSVVLGDRLYILTWLNRMAFIYDANTLDYLQTYSYPREGWGLTTDGKSLIASDGSSKLYFLSPTFQPEKSISVTMNGKPVKYLNELEWINGKIWANIYTTDLIVIIDPATGNVEASIDCTGLLPAKSRKPETDVLNGIAFNPQTGKIYLTGKNWPKLYEIVLKKL